MHSCGRREKPRKVCFGADMTSAGAVKTATDRGDCRLIGGLVTWKCWKSRSPATDGGMRLEHRSPDSAAVRSLHRTRRQMVVGLFSDAELVTEQPAALLQMAERECPRKGLPPWQVPFTRRHGRTMWTMVNLHFEVNPQSCAARYNQKQLNKHRKRRLTGRQRSRPNSLAFSRRLARRNLVVPQHKRRNRKRLITTAVIWEQPQGLTFPQTVPVTALRRQWIWVIRSRGFDKNARAAVENSPFSE